MSDLIKYSAACRALAEAKAVDEVKDLRDKADAMRQYAMQAKNKTLEVDAAEIRLRAERRLGEMLADQDLNKGGAPSKITGRQSRPVISTPTLADAGISKDLSSRAQKLAAVPAEQFEQEVADWRERVEQEGARVTTRLETAGKKALEDAPPERGDITADLVAQLEETQAENESMARVFESDDKVTAALAEAKRFREMNRVLESRITGLMNEKNAAIKQAKHWQKKFEAAEKELKKLSAIDPEVGF